MELRNANQLLTCCDVERKLQTQGAKECSSRFEPATVHVSPPALWSSPLAPRPGRRGAPERRFGSHRQVGTVHSRALTGASAEDCEGEGEVNLQIRRVGFRAGSDEELKALHAVEAPIEAERGSNRMPQSLESYVAFARNLPSQFNDHAWLVQTSDGTPIAAGYCWSNSAGDERVMECDVLVRRDRRREGIGSRLMALICEETVTEGRSLLTWSTFDAVPAADAFCRGLDAHVARVNRESELALSDVDWAMVERWASAERARELRYSLEMVDGAFPEHLRADAVTFHHIMQTAPRDDLDVG